MAEILIVDDERGYCEYLSKVVYYEGHRARVAASVQEGVATARQQRPDLLIADWMLNDDCSGAQLARTLQAEDPELRVIMITGFSVADLRREAATLNHCRCIEKPFDLDELLDTVAEMCAERPMRSGPTGTGGPAGANGAD